MDLLELSNILNISENILISIFNNYTDFQKKKINNFLKLIKNNNFLIKLIIDLKNYNFYKYFIELNKNILQISNKYIWYLKISNNHYVNPLELLNSNNLIDAIFLILAYSNNNNIFVEIFNNYIDILENKKNLLNNLDNIYKFNIIFQNDQHLKSLFDYLTIPQIELLFKLINDNNSIIYLIDLIISTNINEQLFFTILDIEKNNDYSKFIENNNKYFERIKYLILLFLEYYGSNNIFIFIIKYKNIININKYNEEILLLYPLKKEQINIKYTIGLIFIKDENKNFSILKNRVLLDNNNEKSPVILADIVIKNNTVYQYYISNKNNIYETIYVNLGNLQDFVY